MDMVDILRKYIRAERTGNWNLHLQAIQEMLPYLAASGHNLYTKSSRLYVQQMSDLEAQHPGILEKFQQGLHVVRRSDRLWAGLSTDLIIEQVLMRSMKTSGGLTRGRGMTERQRNLWLLSTPACAEVNKAMQELTGVNYNTGEQNKDMTKARQVRDWKDTLTVLQHLKERNPFSSDPSHVISPLGFTHTVMAMLSQPSRLAWQYSSHRIENQLQSTLSGRRVKLLHSPQSHQLRLVVMKSRSITSYSRD